MPKGSHSLLKVMLCSFEDGAIIFGKAKSEKVYQIVNTLNLFTGASNQKINLMKSGLFCGKGVSAGSRARLTFFLS